MGWRLHLCRFSSCLFGLCSCLPFSHELGITSLIICTKYETNDNSEKVLHQIIQLPGLQKSEGNKNKKIARTFL